MGDDAFSGGGMPGPGVSVITADPVNGASKIYQVIANAYTGNDPVVHRASKIDFTLTDGKTIKTRTLFLRQFDNALVPIFAPHYLMDGGVKEIGIRANTTWEIINVIDPENIIVNPGELIGKTGGLNTSPEGETLTFRMADRMNGTSSANMPVAKLILRNAQGNTYQADITGLTSYAVGGLLVWPIDESIAPGDSWYTFADVPYGDQGIDIPPNGNRNPTVDPRSCAAHDPSNRDLWRLPTEEEMGDIITHFRSNGGFGKYGMVDVEYPDASNDEHGYWTASVSGQVLTYFSRCDPTQGSYSLLGYKTEGQTSSMSQHKTFWVHVRCVRTK
jgi:hypothetical protein